MRKKIIAGIIALVLALVGLGFWFNSANATEGDPQPCVPSDAYDEVIHHDAVTHVVHHDAVTHEETVIDQEATPEIWANFSPDHQQGPFEGPPAYPTDDRGTWHNHDKIPGGHEGPDGVYQRDNPNSGRADWFYRHNATPEVSHTITVVDQEAWDETVVDQEAYDEVIHHDAVTCPPNPGDKPDPIVTTQHIEHHYKCSQYYSTDDITTTIDWVLSEDGSQWVQTEPVVTDVFNTWVDPNYDPSKCENTPPPPHHDTPNPAPPVKHNTPAQPAVPTVIEAGL